MSRPAPEDLEDACRLTSPERLRPTKRLKTTATTNTMMIHSTEDADVITKMEVDSVVPASSTKHPPIDDPNKEDIEAEPKIITTSSLNTFSSSSTSSTSPSSSSRDESTFQKVNKLQKYVPYAAHLTKTREELWGNLQANLLSAIAAQGQPLLEWLHACEQYLSAFGFAFSKADHLMLVHLCWRALFTIEHDYTVMRQLTKLLTRLLRETKLLSRTDLQLDWRPLHQLQELTSYSAAARKQTVLFEPEFSTEIRELTAYSRPYFSAASTSEMLTSWRPLLCPYSNQYRKYIAYLRSFLPTMLPPKEHHQGFKLWFDDFMTLWTALPNQELDEYGCYAHLFAMLARDALGYIDWEPHLPLLFERLKKSFNGLMMLSTELTLSAQWIVYMIYPGSGCLASLKQLFAFRLVDGRNMLNAIMEEFIGRIREERGGGNGGEKKKKHWYDYVPESHKLTDAIIADFAAFIWEQYLLSSATTVSSAADFDVEYLYRLSLFCPEQLPKEVVSRLSLAHERFFEPARLQPALQLFSVSLYHLLTNEKVGERYRPEVVPIMRRLIGSLNTNDHSLCYLHLFAIRSVVILGLPIEDLSGLANSKKSQLTSVQRKALKSTAQLEAFASDFLRLCFTIVESNNEDLFGVSKKGLGMKTILYDIFTGLLANVRPAAFRSLVDTLYRYVRGRTVEGANSCFILHKLILATVVMDRGDSYALPKFFNGITASLLEVIEEKEKFSEVCRSEFVYHLTLFTGCFKDGRAMLKYRPALVDLFRRLLALDFQENSQHITLVTNAIGCLFNVVTSIYPSEPAYGARKRFGGSKDQEEEEEENEDEDEKLNRFLTGWPYEVSLKAIDNRWYVPGPEETDFARALFREFIRPQMDLLRSWVDGTSKLEVNKAALEKALGIILSFSGFRDCLPKFADPEAAAAERYFTTAEDVFALDLFDGGEEGEEGKSPLPFRDDLVQLMGRVLRRLKDCPGDNVSSLRLIIKILDFAMFPADAVNAASPADFSLVDEYAASGDDGALAAAMDLQSGGGGGGSSKNLCVFSSIYRTLEGKKKTAYIPLVQYSRLGDYHLRMLSLLKSWPNAQLTAPHRATIEQLFELATGSSADVRADAQAILFDVMESYPQSYPLITAKLAAYLGRQQPSEHYDAFKGTLHLLLGTATKSLLLSESWTALNALWPALLQANWCVEKPKIVDMLDNDLLPLLFGYFYTVPVERKVAILGGGFEKELLSQAEQRGFRAPSQEEVAKVEAAIAEENGKNVALYGKLVGRLVEILEEHKLHWRFYNLGLSLLSFLIRYDRPFPDEAAALFLENLVHDSFKIRLTATSAMRKILFLRKKDQLTKDSSTTTITVQDVDFDSLPLDPLATGGVEAYDSTVFYDKAHIGYYPGCSYQMVVKAGRARKTPENEDFIFTKFSDEAFLGKLFALFAIEREKDEQMSELMETLEKVQDMVPMDNAGLSMISAVDENFVKLWQYLASMYGLFNHQRLLFPRLEALLEEGRPHSDKVVVEVLVGLVKAAPALSGAEMASLNDFLRRRLFDRHLERFHGESKNSWSYLFSSFFANRDRRRFGWVVDYFLRGENQLLEEGSTMTMSGQSAYLAFLSTVLADNWQWPAVGEAVLAKLERHLDHPYQTVRLAIASLLSKSVFYPRIGVAMNVSTDASDMRPSLVAFIGRTVERLDRSLGPLLVAKDGDKKDENSEDDDKGEEGGGGGGGMAAVKSALFDKDSAEGVRLHNYIETVAQWVFGGLINRYLVNSSDFLPFLPYMCVIHTPNKPVQALVNKVVSTLSVMPYPNGELPAIQATVGHLATNWNWHSRHEMTIFLNNFFFSSIYQLRAAEPTLGTLSSLQLILLSLLADEKIEVRESARRTLTNIIAWEVMDAAAKQSLLDRFIASYREKTELREKHAAALGVCAFVYANKRQMTAFLANVVIYLCRLLTDPLPAVQKSVSETLKAFMKGHSDNWVEHKKMFTAEQLAELADISIFSSYIS